MSEWVSAFYANSFFLHALNQYDGHLCRTVYIFIFHFAEQQIWHEILFYFTTYILSHCHLNVIVFFVCALIYSQKWQCHTRKKNHFEIAFKNSRKEQREREKKKEINLLGNEKNAAYKTHIRYYELQAVEWKNREKCKLNVMQV